MHLRSQISYTTTFLSKVSNFRKAVLLVFVLGFSWSLQAQTTDNYPVQTTAYCAAPFSQRLSDYFSSDKRLIVNLLLKDLTKPSVQVYLRWQLEGPGIRIGSRDGFVPASFISLQPGVPSKLSGADLAGAYFFPAALQAEGMDVVDAYNLSLPEGFYTISVQAFEASTGQVVSNTSVTFFVLTSPQPPIMNLPAIGSQISATSLQKVAFQWTPRHFATAESQVVYQLKVCQVPDDSEPNEQIMLSCTEPRLELTVPSTTLTGDITQWIKPLEVGQRYGVQVRAIDLAGQLNNFSNEGYSQVHWFRYGQPCVPPIFSIKSVSSDRVQLQWQAVAQAQSYLVEYQAEGDVSWTTLKTMGTTQMVSELLSRQTYLFRMRTDCGSLVPSEASEVQRWNIAEDAPEPSPQLPKELLNPELIKVQTSGGVAQTPTSLSDLYSNYPVSNSAQLRIAAFSAATTGTRHIPDCALLSGSFSDCQRPHPSVGLPTGGEELGSLKVGDVLGIYDFAVFVTKVKSGPGLAGEGLVRLPFMGNAMALVEFEGVKAKKAQPSDNGGCVYKVSGFFRAKDNVTAQELAQEHQSLVESLLKESDPTAFAGTFEQALKLYDQTVVKLGNQSLTSVQAQPLLIQYLGAILQGSEQLKQQLSELGSSTPGVVALLGDLQKLMDGLQSQLTTLQTTTQTPTVAGLESQYEAIFARIKNLGHNANTIKEDITYQIINSTVVKTGNNYVNLSWEPKGVFDEFEVTYISANGIETTRRFTGTNGKLTGLNPNAVYSYKIKGIKNGQQVASYGTSIFSTAAPQLKAPQNITSKVQNDGTLVLTWDKDKEHLKYKFVYKDSTGKELSLYPTINSVVLQKLDFAQRYEFSLVAYDADNNVSPETSGRLGGDIILVPDIIITPKNTIPEVIIYGHNDVNDAIINYYYASSSFEEPSTDGYYYEPPAETLGIETKVTAPLKPLMEALRNNNSRKWKTYRQTTCPNVKFPAVTGYWVMWATKRVGDFFGTIKVPSLNVAGFFENLFQKAGKDEQEINDETKFDDEEVIAAEIIKYTLIEATDNVWVTPQQPQPVVPVASCMPAPSWTLDIKVCNLIAFAANAGNYSTRKIMTLDADGQPTQVVDAFQAPNGDYYYKDTQKNFEYWKLQGSYLVGRRGQNDWVYWHSQLNKWCGFQPESMQLTVKEESSPCSNTNNGSVTLKLVGGEPPFTFNSNQSPSGSTTNLPFYTFNNLYAGITYSFMATDSKGCRAELKDKTLQSSSGLKLGVSVKDCYNTVELMANCGLAPYTYSSDGKNFGAASGFTDLQKMIPDGESKEFTFYVKDSKGTIATGKVTLKSMRYWMILTPEEQSALYSPKNSDEYWNKILPNIGHLQSGFTSCNGKNDGAVSVRQSTVAEAPFFYGVDGTITVSSNRRFLYADLAGGNHQFVIRDINGCSVSKQVEVKQYDPLSFTTTISPYGCSSDEAAIEIKIKGGNPFFDSKNVAVYYSVLIDGQSSPPILKREGASYFYYKYSTFLKQGRYKIEVSDKNGCTSEAFIEVPARMGPPLTLDYTAIPIPCNLTGMLGSIELTPAGGTPPYSFELAGKNETVSKRDNYFDNLAEGYYMATVTDGKGCSTSKTILIEQTKVKATLVKTEALCSKPGSITLTTTGGQAPYQYSIDNGVTYQTENAFDNLSEGSYTILIKDSQGCTAQVVVDIKLESDSEVVQSIAPLVKTPNGRVNGESITVRYSVDTQSYTFTPKDGVKVEQLSAGRVRVTTSNAVDKAWEGDYYVYFQKSNPNIFLGFYRDKANPCTESGYTADCRPLCKEGFLPEDIYNSNFCSNPIENFPYKSSTFDLINEIAPIINFYSNMYGVSPIAIAGAIADEYNTRTGYKAMLDWLQDDIVLNWLPNFSIEVDAFFNYNSKLLNATRNDIGIGNINIATAKNLYDQNKSKLPANWTYSDIIDYLRSNEGTVHFAALVVKKAESLFAAYTVGYSEEMKEAISVTYYKQGESYYKKFIEILNRDPSHKLKPGEGCRVALQRYLFIQNLYK